MASAGVASGWTSGATAGMAAGALAGMAAGALAGIGCRLFVHGLQAIGGERGPGEAERRGRRCRDIEGPRLGARIESRLACTTAPSASSGELCGELEQRPRLQPATVLDEQVAVVVQCRDIVVPQVQGALQVALGDRRPAQPGIGDGEAIERVDRVAILCQRLAEALDREAGPPLAQVQLAVLVGVHDAAHAAEAVADGTGLEARGRAGPGEQAEGERQAGGQAGGMTAAAVGEPTRRRCRSFIRATLPWQAIRPPRRDAAAGRPH
jgi:hypothetical protein